MLIQLQPNKKRKQMEIKIQLDQEQLQKIAISYAKEYGMNTDGYDVVATLIKGKTNGNHLLIKLVKPNTSDEAKAGSSIDDIQLCEEDDATDSSEPDVDAKQAKTKF
jgi:hypothetical protein